MKEVHSQKQGEEVKSKLGQQNQDMQDYLDSKYMTYANKQIPSLLAEFYKSKLFDSWLQKR